MKRSSRSNEQRPLISHAKSTATRHFVPNHMLLVCQKTGKRFVFWELLPLKNFSCSPSQQQQHPQPSSFPFPFHLQNQASESPKLQVPNLAVSASSCPLEIPRSVWNLLVQSCVIYNSSFPGTSWGCSPASRELSALCHAQRCNEAYRLKFSWQSLQSYAERSTSGSDSGENIPNPCLRIAEMFSVVCSFSHNTHWTNAPLLQLSLSCASSLPTFAQLRLSS